MTEADIRALEEQYEVVLEQQHYTDLTYQDTKLRIFTQMEKLGLTDHATHFPSELSGGQQQRCAIGRALIKNPVLLLCDEPTGALDSVSSREVLRMLAEVNEAYHTTIVMITHNEGIAQMADRVVRIHDGQIISNLKQQKKKVEELEI